MNSQPKLYDVLITKLIFCIVYFRNVLFSYQYDYTFIFCAEAVLFCNILLNVYNLLDILK